MDSILQEGNSGLTENSQGRYSPHERKKFVDALLRDGYCLLPAHFPREKLRLWQSTFEAILKERIANKKASERGPNRYYISLPFEMPFADPAIYEDPDILDILEQASQGELVMPELAVDTPLKDSDFQIIHRDHGQRSPDLPELDPAVPFQFGVNFPLVDITLENGPFEIVPGTHLLTDEACRAKIQSGEVLPMLKPLLMSVGDVMLRDVRALHRGTPNRTDKPRPMVVLGYNRYEHRRPQLHIYIPKAAQQQLSERSQQLLRLNPVVETLDQVVHEEGYSNLYFLKE